MKLSARARQAVRLMMELHRYGGEEKAVSLRSVSEAAGTSTKLLEQLVIGLKSHGLLIGVCGRRGGYLLARPADDISVGDVLRSVIGPLDVAIREDDDPARRDEEPKECRLMWLLLRKQIEDVLDSTTVADLSDADWAREVREMLSEPRPSRVRQRRGASRPWNAPPLYAGG
jgi:Rrf2 family cysteine metabolism transcriptional repressor